MKNIAGKQYDWMIQAVTTNVDVDLSKTFTLNAEACDLQVRRDFRLPADDRDDVERATIYSKNELDELFVGVSYISRITLTCALVPRKLLTHVKFIILAKDTRSQG